MDSRIGDRNEARAVIGVADHEHLTAAPAIAANLAIAASPASLANLIRTTSGLLTFTVHVDAERLLLDYR